MCSEVVDVGALCAGVVMVGLANLIMTLHLLFVHNELGPNIWTTW